MADCHDLFTTFYSNKVKLDEDKRSQLRKSRNAVREKIRKHFSGELKVSKQALFYGQGSYMMRTQIKMLEDHEYDVDDGVYLQHLKDGEWPVPSTVHKWVLDAVTGHTNTDPEDKNTCVRVIYARSYHIDLPIYAKDGSVYKLAHKSKGWIESDPRGITDWFADELKAKGEQLRKIVQYLKAWKDYNEGTNKLPSGLTITVLASNHYSSDSRDDVAMVNTVKNIKNALDNNFSVEKPVVPNEDLLEGWSKTRQDNFLDKLQKIIDKGQEAIDSDDKAKASKKWIILFGSRFPEYNPPGDGNKQSQALVTSAPAVLGTKNERSS